MGSALNPECLKLAVLRLWCCEFECLLWRNRLGILGKILESRIQQYPSAIISQKQTPKFIDQGLLPPKTDSRPEWSLLVTVKL